MFGNDALLLQYVPIYQTPMWLHLENMRAERAIYMSESQLHVGAAWYGLLMLMLQRVALPPVGQEIK